jgi:hypothetical protein
MDSLAGGRLMNNFKTNIFVTGTETKKENFQGVQELQGIYLPWTNRSVGHVTLFGERQRVSKRQFIIAV